jgi:hypothetical protein
MILRQGIEVTALIALQVCGCLRLAARISDLRRDGHLIISRKVKLPSGKWVSGYRLKEAEAA